MPTTVKFKFIELVPVLNNLALLMEWIRPGKMALVLGRMKGVLEEPTVDYVNQRNKLIDELVLWDVGTPAPGQPRDDVPRKRRTRQNDQGVTVFDFGAKEAEFERREREMREVELELTFGRLLTEDDIERIEKERISSQPKDAQGNATQLQAVDFSALAKLIVEDQDWKAPTPVARQPSPAGSET